MLSVQVRLPELLRTSKNWLERIQNQSVNGGSKILLSFLVPLECLMNSVGVHVSCFSADLHCRIWLILFLCQLFIALNGLPGFSPSMTVLLYLLWGRDLLLLFILLLVESLPWCHLFWLCLTLFLLVAVSLPDHSCCSIPMSRNPYHNSVKGPFSTDHAHCYQRISFSW